MGKSIFISGIDTDAGKSYVTGWLASQLEKEGKRVATLKFIQTGNTGRSEDIEVHRKIMGHTLPEDSDLTTSPVIFSYPASPHLAAEIDHKEIPFDKIDESIKQLEDKYDIVLIEGAGGLAVPLSDTMLTIDFVQSRQLPVILVTNGILGSINHTVLSLEALKSRSIPIHSVIYNHHFDKNPIISADNLKWIKKYVARLHPDADFLSCPSISL